MLKVSEMVPTPKNILKIMKLFSASFLLNIRVKESFTKSPEDG